MRFAYYTHPCQHGDRLRGIGPLCAASVAVDLARAATVAVAVAVAVAVKSPLMAPRRWCRNRIKKRPLSSAASFGRFPISVPAAWGVRAADRHLRGRLFSPTSFGEAKEVGRLPGRDPAWSSGRTVALLHPPAGAQSRSRL